MPAKEVIIELSRTTWNIASANYHICIAILR